MPVQIKTKKPSLSINKIDNLIEKGNINLNVTPKSKISEHINWVCKICSQKIDNNNHKCLNCKNLNPENNSSYAMKKPIKQINNDVINKNTIKKEYVNNNQNNNLNLKNTPLKTINKSKIKIEENKLEKKPSTSKLKSNVSNSNINMNNTNHIQINNKISKHTNNINENHNSNKLNSEFSVINNGTNYNCNDPKFNTFGAKKQDQNIVNNKFSLQESNFSFGGNMNLQRKK